MLQVIQGIQSGPYKNIYNPENIFVDKSGTGAGNNWAAGYSMGEAVQDELLDMIDREADGSDSLEVCMSQVCSTRLSCADMLIGFHASPFDRRRYRIWPGFFSA